MEEDSGQVVEGSKHAVVEVVSGVTSMASAMWMASSVRAFVVVSTGIVVTSSSAAITAAHSSAEVSHDAMHGVA